MRRKYTLFGGRNCSRGLAPSTPITSAVDSKEQAEEARLKYPKKEQKRIVVGVVRAKE